MTLAGTYRQHCPTGTMPGRGHHGHPVPFTPLHEAGAAAVMQVHENLFEAQVLQVTLAQGQLHVIDPTL